MGEHSRRHRGRGIDAGARFKQEINIRFVVTNLEGTPKHFYEAVYCQREQMENLIKLHKAQLASDRTSCMSTTAN